MNKWLSVKERKPPNWENVLFCARISTDTEDVKLVVFGYYDYRFCNENERYVIYADNEVLPVLTRWYEITHWMELPKPPSEEGENE